MIEKLGYQFIPFMFIAACLVVFVIWYAFFKKKDVPSYKENALENNEERKESEEHNKEKVNIKESMKKDETTEEFSKRIKEIRNKTEQEFIKKVKEEYNMKNKRLFNSINKQLDQINSNLEKEIEKEASGELNSYSASLGYLTYDLNNEYGDKLSIPTTEYFEDKIIKIESYKKLINKCQKLNLKLELKSENIGYLDPSNYHSLEPTLENYQIIIHYDLRK